MAEQIQKAGRVCKIVITGPESTGKTELTGQLARHFHGRRVNEYARSYVERLTRPYNYLDVLHIARIQEKEQMQKWTAPKQFVFYDTDLIITKVWLDLVYGGSPKWIEKAVRESAIDLYLLCNTDIPWIPDKVRENGGEMRHRLFEIYQSEINRFGFDCRIISGTGKIRIRQAIQIVNKLFPDD
jgi:nicotinamide riboside kinase